MKLYTPQIIKALKIAYDAHHGQLDENGAPYIFHPAFLAAQMDTEEEIITALLHDVVEDTSMTLEDLEREGFSRAVLDAVKALTRKKDGDYTFYIFDVADNPLAAKIKMADLRHNSDPTRNALLPPGEAERYRKKYDNAMRLLQDGVEKREELQRKADEGDPKSMFKIGINYFWGNGGRPKDRRRAFELISGAMEKGLPIDEADWCAEEYGILDAACFVAEMLLDDDEGLVAGRTEPFWFETPPASAEEENVISKYVREIFMYITGRGGAERNLSKAADIAHSIVSRLSFGDRDNDYSLRLRSLLQRANDVEKGDSTVKLYDW